MELVIAQTANSDGQNVRPAVFLPGAADAAPTTNLFAGARNQKCISYPNNVLAFDMNRPAGSSYYHKPRGSWVVKGIYGGTVDAPRDVRIDDNTVFVEFTVTEPLLLSPFTFGQPDHPGFYMIFYI